MEHSVRKVEAQFGPLILERDFPDGPKLVNISGRVYADDLRPHKVVADIVYVGQWKADVKRFADKDAFREFVAREFDRWRSTWTYAHTLNEVADIFGQEFVDSL